MNILLICIYVSLLVFLFIYVPIHIYLRKKHGEAIPRTTYSYKSLSCSFLKYLPVLLLINCLVYFSSNNTELTTAIAIFFSSCYVASYLKMFLWEYQRKRAGGKEKRWE